MPEDPTDAATSFPKDFLWGASTSSHQVEGGNHNQWTVWELTNATELAKNAQKNYGWLPVWDEIKKQAGSPSNYISGRGVDHYNRYKTDFGIAKKLNMNSFRFGIEWARIEPEEGVWDEAAFAHYRDYIQQLNDLGLEPVMNIWHWTMPTWFTDKGGFEKAANLKYFDRFVEKVGSQYGHMVRYIITLNEPNVYASFSYQLGKWPPQEKSPLKLLIVYWNLVKAHRRSYRILKRLNGNLQVGIAAQLGNIQAKRQHNLLDELSTKVMRYLWNWWFLRRIRRHQDFIGINYYFTDYYNGLFQRKNPKQPLNDLGWYMEPEGLYPLLLRSWARFKQPVIVTENGVADAKDEYRRWWIEETIVAMQRAISEGVQIKGYFHWSLLDNFEWAEGWWPKFGLVEVNRRTMERKVRPSARWFAEKIDQLGKSK